MSYEEEKSFSRLKEELLTVLNRQIDAIDLYEKGDEKSLLSDLDTDMIEAEKIYREMERITFK